MKTKYIDTLIKLLPYLTLQSPGSCRQEALLMELAIQNWVKGDKEIKELSDIVKIIFKS